MEVVFGVYEIHYRYIYTIGMYTDARLGGVCLPVCVHLLKARGYWRCVFWG